MPRHQCNIRCAWMLAQMSHVTCVGADTWAGKIKPKIAVWMKSYLNYKIWKENKWMDASDLPSIEFSQSGPHNPFGHLHNIMSNPTLNSQMRIPLQPMSTLHFTANTNTNYLKKKAWYVFRNKTDTPKNIGISRRIIWKYTTYYVAIIRYKISWPIIEYMM